MSDTTIDEIPNWVCHPDDEPSHLTRTVVADIGTGCPDHVIAGGCSIPQDELKQLLATEVLRELEKINWAGCGCTTCVSYENLTAHWNKIANKDKL